MQRPNFTPRPQQPVRSISRSQRAITINQCERVQRPIEPMNLRKRRLNDLPARNLLPPNKARQRLGAQKWQFSFIRHRYAPAKWVNLNPLSAR
jgi:hypothetical protein